MRKFFAIVSFLWILCAVPVQAGDFSETEMEKFIASLESLNSSPTDILALQRYMAEMQNNFAGMVDDDGQLRFFGKMVEWSVLNPDERAIISRASNSAGFASLNEWGATGDIVFTAFLALETPAEEIAAVEQRYSLVSEPGYTNSLSDTERENLLAVMAMFKALKSVSPSTLAIVRPYRDRLSVVLK